jgi:hypothetical protein
MSTHPALPLPVYPDGHAPHVRDPGVFVQTVSVSQPPLLVEHSLMSTHPVLPVPV